MAEELAYALITPYSLLKSRTGGIIGRLLSLTNLDFVGARMYAPTDRFVDKYMATIEEQEASPRIKKALLGYVNSYFRPDNRFRISNRTVLLLFRGEDAVRSLRDDVIGPISDHLKGDTVRGTYGDFVAYPNGEVEYFEPAVLTAGDPESNRKQLRLLAEHAESDGGVVDHVVKLPDPSKAETTLVILKPDNFRKRSSRPGNIIDMFSRAGLFIVGAKLLRLSVAQAEEFYGPLRRIFVDKLKAPVVSALNHSLDKAFDFRIPWETCEQMADLLKDLNAECEFNKIVRYMTGVDPAEVAHSPELRKAPGREKCLALLYRGENAVHKIRERLGVTDPEKAADGTVRSVYGFDLMRNSAHASDSPQNAEREGKIIGLWRGCDDAEILKEMEPFI
jgi:nucleoside diphosphate kinase